MLVGWLLVGCWLVALAGAAVVAPVVAVPVGYCSVLVGAVGHLPAPAAAIVGCCRCCDAVAAVVAGYWPVLVVVVLLAVAAVVG